MPRPVSEENFEDTFSDEDFEAWEEVSTDFGEKIVWSVGTRLVATFTGYRDMPDPDNSELMIRAAQFVDTADGEKKWCWLPVRLSEGLSTVNPGDMVMILCDGEEKNKNPRFSPTKTFIVRVKRK
jgi:hypothetical protein